MRETLRKTHRILLYSSFRTILSSAHNTIRICTILLPGLPGHYTFASCTERHAGGVCIVHQLCHCCYTPRLLQLRTGHLVSVAGFQFNNGTCMYLVFSFPFFCCQFQSNNYRKKRLGAETSLHYILTSFHHSPFATAVRFLGGSLL